MLHRELGRVSIAFVDDHPIVLEGVTSIFSGDNSFQVVAKGNCAFDAVDICSKHSLDVVVLDFHMPGDVLAAIRDIGQISPRTRVLVFTAATEVDGAVKALDAGAHGYVLKGSTVEELRSAIASVVGGDTFITPSLANRVVAALRSAQGSNNDTIRLSFREQQITTLLLQGQTNKEIGSTLKITEQTVKHYMTVLIQKFRVRNRLEVAIAAQKLNVVARRHELPAQHHLN